MRFEWLAGPPFHFSPQVSAGSFAFPTAQTDFWELPVTFQLLVLLFNAGRCKPELSWGFLL